MSSKQILVTDKYELLALHRGLLEARFSDSPNDIDVFLSPILSKLHRNVVTALIEINDQLTSDGDKWKAWLLIDEKRREWAIAVKRARLSSAWLNSSLTKKIEISQEALSPFEVTDHELFAFIKAVDAKESLNNSPDPAQ